MGEIMRILSNVLRFYIVGLIIFITMLASCDVVYGQYLRGSPIIINISSDISDNDKVFYVAKAGGEYNNIKSALKDYKVGGIILLAPEYFNEDITISKDSVNIRGLHTDLTKINSLTVLGKDCSFESLTVLGNLNLIRSIVGEWHYLSNRNYFKDMKFYGDCNLGLPEIKLLYPFTFNDCKFLGEDSRLYFNCYSGGQSNYFNNSYINGWNGLMGSSSSGLSIIVDNGGVVFDGGHVYIDTLYYGDPQVISLVYLQNISQCSINYIIMSENTDQYKVLTIKHGFYLFNNDVVIQGKFEFNAEHCQLNLGWDGDGLKNNDITFNSTTNSRLTYVQQLGYNSTSVIKGNRLDKLHISHSIFHLKAPTNLGSDTTNSWGAFIDN